MTRLAQGEMMVCLIGPVGMTILRSNHGTPTVYFC